MINARLEINRLIEKYGSDNEKCRAASIVKINDKLIFSLDLHSVDDSYRRLITECDGVINEYRLNYLLPSASVCALPALAAIIYNLRLNTEKADKVILSGENLLCSYLNYALKFNGTVSTLCAGNNKQKLLHLVSNTDINMFFNTATQNEEEIIDDDYKLNIIAAAEAEKLIIRNIPKFFFSLENISGDALEIIPALAMWISERKINEETFFPKITDPADFSLLDNGEILTVILINIP